MNGRNARRAFSPSSPARRNVALNTTHSKKTQHTAWPESINLSNQLFFEADRLSEAAYALLSNQPISAQTLLKFSALKRRADNKYIKARQEWLDAKNKINR
jgi:hypothetical protein